MARTTRSRLEDTVAAGSVLGGRDFRRLLAARMSSQFADGIFIDAVLLTVVFMPERQDTLRGFALATALLLVPFSVMGPLTGVFVDRWSRRRLLVAIPPLRAAAALLVIPGTAAAALSYLGALVVFSANRLFQATLTAVIPRVLDAPSVRPSYDEHAAHGMGATDAVAARSDGQATPSHPVHGDRGTDPRLFAANTTMAVGGSATLFAGLFAGGQLEPRIGIAAALALACAAWCVSSVLSLTLSTGLLPRRPASAAPRGELAAVAAVAAELADGLRRILATPAALAPILAVTANQVVQMVVIVVCLVLTKEESSDGLLSFSWLLAAGGLGVFLGFVTVAPARSRVPERLLIGLAFVLAALATVPAIAALGVGTLAVGAVPMGVAYAWTKVPADTLAQRAVPDRYRGRVFTVMDLGFNTARVLAALAAIPLVSVLGLRATLVAAALAFLLFAPVVPLWLAGGRDGAAALRG